MKNITASICAFFLLIGIVSAQAWVDMNYSFETDFDITYGTAQTFAGKIDTLQLDVSYPVDDTPPTCGRPLAIIIHGGAWFSGDKNEGYPRRLREDFAQRGYVAASVNYRLGLFNTDKMINCNIPEWNCFNMTDSSEWYRANYRAIQDVNGALRFLVNASEDYLINPDNIVIIGESAGGFVALGVGFIDDDSEILTSLVEDYPDAPAPNTLYENACIQNYGLATSIQDMQLQRPALGTYKGNLNSSVNSPYKIRAVGNIYGGAFNNIFRNFNASSPALYLYHQPCDLIVPMNYNRLLTGFNDCLMGFPANCGQIINRPFAYGSLGIKNLIDQMSANQIPTCDYFFDDSGNNYNCLQQTDPNLNCHAIDNYVLRTGQMAQYFANFIDTCSVTKAVENHQISSDLATLHPNPTGDFLNIDLKSQIKTIEIKVLNVLGITAITHYFSNQSQCTIDIQNLEDGMYVLWIQLDGQKALLPFIKN